MMDRFFDCLNVSNRKEWQEKQKDFLKLYESVDDIRFEWLDSFLLYFEQWKESIQNRDDSNYTAHARSNMFISWQTHEGIQITVHSFKEVCKFLLEHLDHPKETRKRKTLTLDRYKVVYYTLSRCSIGHYPMFFGTTKNKYVHK